MAETVRAQANGHRFAHTACPAGMDLYNASKPELKGLAVESDYTWTGHR